MKQAPTEPVYNGQEGREVPDGCTHLGLSFIKSAFLYGASGGRLLGPFLVLRFPMSRCGFFAFDYACLYWRARGVAAKGIFPPWR